MAAPRDKDRAAAARYRLWPTEPGWRLMSRLSIIMPVLDEGEAIAGSLNALAELRALGVEVVVVDGGSHDATVQRARLRADHVIPSPRGRAVQMNAGAAQASGNVLMF